MSETKVSIKNLYKVFGKSPSDMISLLQKGISKAELLEKYSHVLGLEDVNIDIKENQTTNNAKKFVAVVFMDEKELGIGFGNAKKEAEQEACKNSLTLL